MGRRLALSWVVAAVICSAPPRQVGAQTPEPPPPDSAAGVPSPESLPLTQDLGRRLTLPVMVNGQGPFDFLVDTGSDRTVISRELAARLALPPGPRVIIHQSTGADNVETVVIDRLTVGSREIRHIESPSLEARNLGGAGMLGVDALRDLHVVMDFKEMRMSSSPSRAEPLDDHTFVVSGRSRFGQLILANARIHDQPVLVVLDSGSEVSVGNPALLRLLTGRSRSAEPLKSTTLVTVTGRRMVLELDDIAEADLGGIVIHNMPLAFGQMHIFDRFGLTRQPALMLGMDVMSLCRRVTVDLRRREATFTLN